MRVEEARFAAALSKVSAFVQGSRKKKGGGLWAPLEGVHVESTPSALDLVASDACVLCAVSIPAIGGRLAKLEGHVLPPEAKGTRLPASGEMSVELGPDHLSIDGEVKELRAASSSYPNWEELLALVGSRALASRSLVDPGALLEGMAQIGLSRLSPALRADKQPNVSVTFGSGVLLERWDGDAKRPATSDLSAVHVPARMMSGFSGPTLLRAEYLSRALSAMLGPTTVEAGSALDPLLFASEDQGMRVRIVLMPIRPS